MCQYVHTLRNFLLRLFAVIKPYGRKPSDTKMMRQALHWTAQRSQLGGMNPPKHSAADVTHVLQNT
jgi:hypothetical protein